MRIHTVHTYQLVMVRIDNIRPLARVLCRQCIGAQSVMLIHHNNVLFLITPALFCVIYKHKMKAYVVGIGFPLIGLKLSVMYSVVLRKKL